MGLKFQREDSLDKMFEEFAILPENKEKIAEEKNKAIERFLTPEKKDENKDNKKDQNA
ncbi:SPJ_0845 family protein [Enterococcus mediterraneensis]|uniref:SPJ_0845 family protein n=1 Tax=Enterococcus mediterraneensis TaxID=2364791 RepID=UPI0013E09CAA|nr:SPJ_0845 family protein [Enterococcus mediterraneensis]